jgi:hypothetical protein
LISSSSKTCGYNDISRLLDEFFVDMTVVMIPTIPAFTKIISDTLNIHVSYPFGGSNQDHCEVDAKYEEKIRREIFSIPSFFFTRHSHDRNELVRAETSSFYLQLC